MIICVCMIVLWIVLDLGKYTAPKYYKTNECLIMTMTKNIFNLSQGDMQVLMIMAILPSSSPSNPKDFYREYILHTGCWEIIVLTLFYLDKKGNIFGILHTYLYYRNTCKLIYDQMHWTDPNFWIFDCSFPSNARQKIMILYIKYYLHLNIGSRMTFFSPTGGVQNNLDASEERE